VQAMWLMLQQDQPTDFVIGSGQVHTVRDFCRVAFGVVGLDYHDFVVVDPAYYRPAEAYPLVAEPSQAHQILGWTPEIRFDNLVEMMVKADLEAQQP